jgi:hypothetical protein
MCCSIIYYSVNYLHFADQTHPKSLFDLLKNEILNKTTSVIHVFDFKIFHEIDVKEIDVH